jgi:2'-5' RNA ligase
VDGDERLRLFCALRLPDDVLDGIVAWQERHLSRGRIVPRDHLHVTTAFLGSTPASELEGIASAVGTVDAFGPIRFRVGKYRETRSVGMLVLDDVDGRGRLYAEQLHELLEILGVYRPEKRRWLPHVTVVRFRERPRLRPLLPEIREFVPSDASVYLSRLSPSGAQYEVLESVALGG